MSRQQRLYVPTQLGISLAGIVKERTSAIRVLLQRLLQKLVNLLPAFRSHRSSDECPGLLSAGVTRGTTDQLIADFKSSAIHFPLAVRKLAPALGVKLYDHRQLAAALNYRAETSAGDLALQHAVIAGG
jgi:hypothetical protein